MQVLRNTDMLHPLLQEIVARINKEIIQRHNMPIRLFETGRTHERHQIMIDKGKTKDVISRHLYDLERDPPLYATSVDYVYFDGKWSWNLRDSTTLNWYLLFGNLVLDKFPDINWDGVNRKDINYCQFNLKNESIIKNLDKINCIIY